MKNILICTFILMLPLTSEGLPTDQVEYAAWESKMMKSIEEQKSLPKDEAISNLGKWTVQMNLPYHKEREGRPVFSSAKNMLLDIPGHAEHFGKQVTESYNIVKQGYAEGKSAGEIIQWYAYRETSRKAFQILALLPSAETVRVLGKMLEDDWKYPEYENPAMRESYGETLDCRAMSYLMQLPIANPPTANLLDASERSENVHLWKQWYSEIESGRRTFRFIGDDTEYDLRGPVRRSAGMDTDRTGKRTQIATPGGKQMPEARPTPGRFLPYLIGGLFLLAGLGFYLRGKREHPKNHHSA